MDEDNDDGLGGRGVLRREFEQAHRYAELLVVLDDVQLRALDLPPEIQREIDLARSLPPSGARNRQIKRVDKVVRQLEDEQLEAIGRFLEDPTVANRAHEREVSGWLKRLLKEGDAAVAELVTERPDVEIQRLRQLVRNARAERKKGAPGRADRALREILGE